VITGLARIVIGAFGLAVFVLSIWGMFAPLKLIELVKSIAVGKWGMHVAVIVRIVLGAALIVAAAQSRFPTAFQVLGWLTLAAALGLLLVGQRGMGRVVAWFEHFSPALVRAWLLLGLAFGGVLFYGVL
jgi:hypothetical protein